MDYTDSHPCNPQHLTAQTLIELRPLNLLSVGVSSEGCVTFPRARASGVREEAGEHQLSLRGIPPGYTIASILSGSSNLLNNPLRIPNRAESSIQYTEIKIILDIVERH